MNYEKNSKLNDVIDDDFDDGEDNIYDVNKVYDKNMWPETLLTDIFGFYNGYNPNFKDQISVYFRTEPKVKEITDNILGSIPKQESMFIRNAYIEGKSIKEIAKQNKMKSEKIIELKKLMLRRLRNPKLARQYFPIFKEIDETIVGEKN